MKRTGIIFLLCAFSLFAQDAKDLLRRQYDYARALQTEGKIFDAVTEYERLICFDTLRLYAFDANKNIADCYRRAAQFKNAIRYTGQSIVCAKNQKTMYEQKTELVKLHILNRSFASAANVLHEIEQDPTFTNHSKEIHYWRGWMSLFQDDWEMAAREFAFVDSAAALGQFCLQMQEKRCPVTTLKIFSAIIPGSGQMLTGHVWSGLLSLGWNVLWGYLTFDAALANRAGDALLIGDLLWLRFYTGNIENAEKFAVEKNTLLFQDALRYLQDEFKGAKP